MINSLAVLLLALYLYIFFVVKCIQRHCMALSALTPLIR